MINQQTYYQLEDPAVYEAEALALDIVNEDLKNQMIRREHRNYQLLADEVRNQQIKKQALLQLSREDAIDKEERALYEDILLAPAQQAPAPAPAPVQREAVPVQEEEEQEEEQEEDEEEDPLPASLQIYNDMDQDQLDIVEDAFLEDIENMDADQSRAVYEMAQKTIDNYGDRINDDVLNMMERLKGAILDKLGIEEKEEEPEEEEEEEQEEEIRPRTVSEYKTYLKNLNFYQYVDGLRKDELVVIYDMLKQGQTDERVRAQIDEYHFDRNPRQRRGRRPQKGKGLKQSGNGIKEDLQKIMLLVGSQKAGNQSLKLQKEINTIQKKLKKQLDKMKKKDQDKLMKEVNRQQIKRMAKSQIGLGHRD
jgi:hypothetical protein